MTQQGYASAAFSPEEATDLALEILSESSQAKDAILRCQELLPKDPAAAICACIYERIAKKETINA
jgi:hypothetical protein